MPINRSLLAIPSLTILCLAVGAAFSPSQVITSPCRGPDSYSAAQIAHLQALMVSTNPLDSAFLRDVHLPRVAGSAIQLVTTDSVCSLVVQAWTQADTLTHPPLTSLYVIQVGPAYDAIDAQNSGGEYSQHLVLDSLFHYQAPYLF